MDDGTKYVLREPIIGMLSGAGPEGATAQLAFGGTSRQYPGQRASPARGRCGGRTALHSENDLLTDRVRSQNRQMSVNHLRKVRSQPVTLTLRRTIRTPSRDDLLTDRVRSQDRSMSVNILRKAPSLGGPANRCWSDPSSSWIDLGIAVHRLGKRDSIFEVSRRTHQIQVRK